MKKIIFLCALIYSNSVFTQNAPMTKFRHTLFIDENKSITQNSAKVAKFDLLGGVHADIDDKGEIIFNNNSYEAVVAYIHNEKGDVVDKVIIPPNNESLFNASYAAIKEIPHFLINNALENQNNNQTKLQKLLSLQGNTLSIPSGINVSDFPKNGAISYAIGTNETIAATAISVPVKFLTSAMTYSAYSMDDINIIPEKAYNKAIQKTMMALVSDAEFYNQLIIEVQQKNNKKIIELTVDLFLKKGKTEFQKNLAQELIEEKIYSRFIDTDKMNKVLDSLKAHEFLSNLTVSASLLHNAIEQNSIGPIVLYTDIPLYQDSKLGQIALPQLFNWENTPLENKYSEKYWAPYTNEYDSAGKWYNPTTWWSAPANAEAQRWSSTSESKEAQDYISYLKLKNQKGISCADNPNMGMCLPNKTTNMDMLNNLSMNTQDRTSHFGATAYLNKFNNNQTQVQKINQEVAYNRQTPKENFYYEPTRVSTKSGVRTIPAYKFVPLDDKGRSLDPNPISGSETMYVNPNIPVTNSGEW